jgi:triacylglycerol lipase
VRPQPATGRLARALQIVLALEILILGFGLGLLHLQGALSGGQWAAIALGWYFGFRALAVGKNFLQTWLARSPRPAGHRIGLWATLRLLLAEYATHLVVYSILFPFERWLVPQSPAMAAAGRGTPLLLIPGFACNRGYWWLFIRWLRAAGIGPVYAVSLEPLFGSIDENARRLGAQIEALCAATGAPKVILIGHSMGGVTARAYLHHAGAARVERIVTLGSPHRGTVLTQGLEALGANLREMSIDSAWGAALNAHEQRPCPVPIAALITPHDDIVAPQDSCILRYPNARNLYLPGVGHLEMVLSRVTLRATLAALRDEPWDMPEAPLPQVA